MPMVCCSARRSASPRTAGRLFEGDALGAQECEAHRAESLAVCRRHSKCGCQRHTRPEYKIASPRRAGARRLARHDASEPQSRAAGRLIVARLLPAAPPRCMAPHTPAGRSHVRVERGKNSSNLKGAGEGPCGRCGSPHDGTHPQGCAGGDARSCDNTRRAREHPSSQI
jgi:hypothetical protein